MQKLMAKDASCLANQETASEDKEMGSSGDQEKPVMVKSSYTNSMKTCPMERLKNLKLRQERRKQQREEQKKQQQQQQLEGKE